MKKMRYKFAVLHAKKWKAECEFKITISKRERENSPR